MRLNPLFPAEDNLALNTDLYELTMAAAYFYSGKREDTATFELFTRKLPSSRSFLLAAGLEQALHYITHFRFPPEAVAYLRSLEIFRHVGKDFFDHLLDLRFSGEVRALPEGTPFFAQEPMLQITGPIIEAQVLESFLINTLNFQTMVASKAARLMQAGQGTPIIDFGSRRAHSPQAAALAARAAYVGGCSGTSNVWAGRELGIPLFGTMAHSFVQFFENESEAFQLFRDVFPQHATLLVDTYDTLEGVRTALEVGGFQGIRLDSGDLAELAFQSRRLLDAAGRTDARIFASGNLDEERIRNLARREAPIDALGVGTELVVSQDFPTCDLVYKLVDIHRRGRVRPSFKSSPGKATIPFQKQVFRTTQEGVFVRDRLDRHDAPARAGEEPLLRAYVRSGRIISELPSVDVIREYAQEQIERLPASLKLLHSTEDFPVQIEESLLGAWETGKP